MEKFAVKLQELVKETANSFANMSCNEEGWHATFIVAKKKMTKPSLPELLEEMCTFIETSRKAKEASARSSKLFTL